MIIESYENGYSAVVLSNRNDPITVGKVLLDGVACECYTHDSPNTVYKRYCQNWDYVEKVPFFGVEGYPEDCEAWENSHE